MQLSLDVDGQVQILRDIHARLAAYYTSFPPRYQLLEPVSQLVMSMLGGLTYGHVSRAAHQGLTEHFPSWSDVRDAETSRVFKIIRNVTYPDVKARRIQKTLGLISPKIGEPDLSCLDMMSVPEAHFWLERLPGVGPKTAAAVLNTSTLRKRSLVIDTHQLRILRQLGFIAPTASIKQAYPILMSILPKDWTARQIDDHHMLFKRLGQHLCRPTLSHCRLCPLADMCDFSGRNNSQAQGSQLSVHALSGPNYSDCLRRDGS